MLLRSLLRATAAPLRQSQWQLTNFRSMASKTPKGGSSKVKKPQAKFDKKTQSKSDLKEKKPEEVQAASPESIAKQDAELRRRLLAEDEKNPALDVGPDGRPLFTSAPSLSLLTKNDINHFFRFSMEELNEVLPEGLPLGMMKEFEESCRSALLVRQSFIDLRDNFRQAADPSLVAKSRGLKVRKQIVLDGPLSCGKSILLAMLVNWARKEGWLVLYVPQGRDWTHGGLFYKNPETSLWDTPVQAVNILRDFLKYNKACLEGITCTIFDPIPLGEGAGVGWQKGRDKMQISEGTTLCQLVEAGLQDTHAAVGVVVRLRKELSKVTSVPVLIAIDQYNNWFTFTDFEEAVTDRSFRPIHAREVTTVNAFRSMMHDDMMVGAFSHSTAVGKLRQELPDVPPDARTFLPRYSLDEAATVCHYYLRQRLVKHDAFSEENWKKIFYLSNGNGTEMRYLVPFMR
ncbi:mitochondrial 28S ribosomal protein S29-like protein [Perilla frutescens var. frutescens]|nr:mitochondrial 28S ribosomal protein S29-like protein [Perilla frutescens var. frutescens]